MFRHVNGKVQVGGFRCPEGEFAAIEPAYTGLPEGVIERRYDPDAPGGRPKHVLITAGHNQTGGLVPWPEGDAMLAKAAAYPALHEAAFPPPEQEDPEPLSKAEHIDAAYGNNPAYAALVEEIAAGRGEPPAAVIARMKGRG